MARFTMLAATVFSGVLLIGPTHAVAAECNAKVKKSAFSRCIACHNYDKPRKKQGPSLQGVMGRKAGTLAGFRYSKDMKEAGKKGLVWNKVTLASYLKPKKKGGGKAFVGSFIGKKRAGTRMVFAGFNKQSQIEAVVCFLEQSAK